MRMKRTKLDESHDRLSIEMESTSDAEGWAKVIPDPIPSTHRLCYRWEYPAKKNHPGILHVWVEPVAAAELEARVLIDKHLRELATDDAVQSGDAGETQVQAGAAPEDQANPAGQPPVPPERTDPVPDAQAGAAGDVGRDDGGNRPAHIDERARLTAMTRAALLTLGAERGVELGEKMTKAQMVAAILDAKK